MRKMRHELVTRFAFGLCALLLGACLVFALFTAPASPEARTAGAQDEAGLAALGAELYALHCAACHEVAEMVEILHEGPERQAATSSMRDFLATHGGSDAGEDRAIVEWLAREAWPGG